MLKTSSFLLTVSLFHYRSLSPFRLLFLFFLFFTPSLSPLFFLSFTLCLCLSLSPPSFFSLSLSFSPPLSHLSLPLVSFSRLFPFFLSNKKFVRSFVRSFVLSVCVFSLSLTLCVCLLSLFDSLSTPPRPTALNEL